MNNLQVEKKPDAVVQRSEVRKKGASQSFRLKCLRSCVLLCLRGNANEDQATPAFF